MGRAIALFLCAALWTGAVWGQSAQTVLTIDRERLFAETQLGARVSRGIEARIAALQAENEQIENELIEEELDLTGRRPSLTPEEFRALADAFDEKVQAIRREQDGKARELTQARDQARQSFFVEIADVLGQIMEQRGATIILDTSTVFVSANRIDITDVAIQSINQVLGEGGVLPLGQIEP